MLHPPALFPANCKITTTTTVVGSCNLHLIGKKQADDSIINTGLKIIHMKTGRNTDGENQEAAPFFSTEDAGEGWGLGKA